MDAVAVASHRKDEDENTSAAGSKHLPPEIDLPTLLSALGQRPPLGARSFEEHAANEVQRCSITTVSKRYLFSTPRGSWPDKRSGIL
jgi:hypothetical protein